MRCLRCGKEMEFIGKKSFREGTNWVILGDLGEWFEGKQDFDLHACPKCGHVEFFISGVRPEFAPQV